MNNGKAELLREFITNDPYLAFFISFFGDIGLEPIIFKPVVNSTTGTKFYAIDKKTLVIEQNSKTLEIRIKDAKKIIENFYGPIPLQLI